MPLMTSTAFFEATSNLLCEHFDSSYGRVKPSCLVAYCMECGADESFRGLPTAHRARTCGCGAVRRTMKYHSMGEEPQEALTRLLRRIMLHTPDKPKRVRPPSDWDRVFEEVER